MKLVDLQYYVKFYSAAKVYMNHEDWLEILKELGYVDKIYEKVDYYHIFPTTTAHSTINTFNFKRNKILLKCENSSMIYKLIEILTYEEKIIKDIIE